MTEPSASQLLRLCSHICCVMWGGRNTCTPPPPHLASHDGLPNCFPNTHVSNRLVRRLFRLQSETMNGLEKCPPTPPAPPPPTPPPHPSPPTLAAAA